MARLLSDDGDMKTIEKVQDLLELLRGFSKDEFLEGVYLRGQRRAEWGLIPSMGRETAYAGIVLPRFTLEQERSLLHRFSRQAWRLRERSLDPWEVIFLARHHGLPVRLLDWTSNPLVALFWATEFLEVPPGDGAVWALRATDIVREHRYLNVLDPETPEPLSVVGARIVPPIYVDPRLGAQASTFTIQDDPYRGLETYDPSSYDKADLDIDQITKWIVPGPHRVRILEELEKLGINLRTLYPDLDGLAGGLWRTEVLRSAPKQK